MGKEHSNWRKSKDAIGQTTKAAYCTEGVQFYADFPFHISVHTPCTDNFYVSQWESDLSHREQRIPNDSNTKPVQDLTSCQQLIDKRKEFWD